MMETSRITDLGAKVVTELIAAGYPASFSYLPSYHDIDCSSFRVIVSDAGGEVDVSSRKFLAHTDTLRIVILYSVASEDGEIEPTKVDYALRVMDDIIARLALSKIGPYSPVSITRQGGGEKAHYFPDNLRERIFAAAIDIKYVSHQRVSEGLSS